MHEGVVCAAAGRARERARASLRRHVAAGGPIRTVRSTPASQSVFRLLDQADAILPVAEWWRRPPVCVYIVVTRFPHVFASWAVAGVTLRAWCAKRAVREAAARLIGDNKTVHPSRFADPPAVNISRLLSARRRPREESDKTAAGSRASSPVVPLSRRFRLCSTRALFLPPSLLPVAPYWTVPELRAWSHRVLVARLVIPLRGSLISEGCQCVNKVVSSYMFHEHQLSASSIRGAAREGRLLRVTRSTVIRADRPRASPAPPPQDFLLSQPRCSAIESRRFTRESEERRVNEGRSGVQVADQALRAAPARP